MASNRTGTETLSQEGVQAQGERPRPYLEAAPASQMAVRGLDLPGSLARYPGLSLGVAAVVLMLGLPMAWMMGRPVYDATGTLHVAPRFMKNLDEDLEHQFQSSNQYHEFVQHQVRTINRFDVLMEALTRLGEQRTIWQQPQESERKAAERLQPALKIKPVPDTYLITVSLERDKADGLAEIVNAVMASYLEVARREEFYGVDERVSSLRAEQESLQQSIERLVARRTAIAQELGVTTFIESRPNSYDQLLVDNQEALSAAQRRLIEAESQLASLDASQRADGNAALEAAVQSILDKDSVLASGRAGLTARRNELVLKQSGLASDHPGRRVIARDLAVVDEEIARISRIAVERARRMVLDERRAKVFEARRVERSLLDLFNQQYARASRYAELYSEALGLGSDADRIRKRLDAVNDRLNFLSLESKAPGFVRIVTSARPPETPVRGGRTKMLVLVLAAAAALGCGIPMVRDMVDRRIRSGHELTAILGFAPIVDFPVSRSEGEPVHLAGENLRRLALSLLRERRGRAALTVCMTSVRPRAGQTTLLCALGEELRVLGLRTLLVDVNPFSTDVRHKGEDAAPGLIEALNGSATPEEIITRSANGGLDHVCLGAAHGAMHLNNGTELNGILQALSARYDVLLLDAAPILDFADTELVCVSTDLTVLLVQAGQVTAEEARRAARALERLSLPVVASVITQTPVPNGRAVMRQWGRYLRASSRRRGFRKAVRVSQQAVPLGEGSGEVL